ncbi:MAG TPA: hypothetical protein PLJ60_00545 [Chryseolinea sp.]|nr:hypothetical protein [Chryseolinea sp.]HPH46699.1 hypothetical protein [Chryseolinea sp.]HPM28795.1 hypothetical protein [Chryseolinea sp.]
MKSPFSILIVCFFSLQVFAQESPEKIMEGRAREMARVIGLNDKEQWKKFIQENFTQAFINKNMKVKVVNSDANDGETVQETTEADNLEAKAAMFSRLHDDFGNGKITSLKASTNKIEMVIDASQLKGTFILTFESKKPYLIEGLGIQAGN